MRPAKHGRPRLPAGDDIHGNSLFVLAGYVFPDAPSISPYLEQPRTGPTSRFCSELAARLRCYVVAGYPERLPPNETDRVHLEDGKEIERVGANTAALYGPDGALVGGYRKTNLYETDMTWAKPGTGFTTFQLPPPLGALTLAICMDLNTQPPAVWSSLRTGPYELAAYCAAQRTRVLVLVNAWLDSKDGREDEPDWRTVNYWALRLRPLWARVVREGEGEGEGEDADEEDDDDADGGDESMERPGTVDQGRQPGEELVVVTERDAHQLFAYASLLGITFAGSSSLFSLRPNSGRPHLLHAMNRRQEGVEVWEYPKAIPLDDAMDSDGQYDHDGS
ncbi:hypothetical protein ONZ51_g11677 [Trametes cubensis]|uniref:CN hydrolase domain-containing protein n=1 Tax=Trametes cubensis TaxID=1111947 RepID=A0AAD7TH77_9APHY|nr:hypothetical protein ONZ51_g11677 [Trametes cubensis]